MVGPRWSRGEKSYLRFRIPWYSHSSSLLVSSFFRFPFLLCSLRCAGSLDEDDEDEDEEEEEDDADDEHGTGNGDAEGMDAIIDAGDAGRSDCRDDEVGCQRGRLIVAG